MVEQTESEKRARAELIAANVELTMVRAKLAKVEADLADMKLAAKNYREIQ